MTENSAELHSFVENVSSETAKRWRESYKRKVDIELEEISTRIVKLLAENFTAGEWRPRGQNSIAERAQVANARQVAHCVGHLWNVLYESDHTLNGTPVMYFYEDNRLHEKSKSQKS